MLGNYQDRDGLCAAIKNVRLEEELPTSESLMVLDVVVFAAERKDFPTKNVEGQLKK